MHAISEGAVFGEHFQNISAAYFLVKLRDRFEYFSYQQSVGVHIESLSLHVHHSDRLFIQIATAVHIERVRDIDWVDYHNHKNPHF